jgi:hypothetical protein
MATFCLFTFRKYTRVLSQLIRYSEVCSGRVNTHLEVDNGQHESVISYGLLVTIYCCYIMLTTYSDKYRPQTTLVYR